MTNDGPTTVAIRLRARRIAGWAGLGFVLLQLGWVLVIPPAAGPDEFDHVYRASAVSMGHWQPGVRGLPIEIARGLLVPARVDLVEASAPACARLPYTAPFNCRPYRQLGGGLVEVASGSGAYNPTFYAVVGTLARGFNGNTAIYVMRAIAAALCALAFAAAVYLTSCWARTRWPLVALLLAALPTTVYSTIVAAPNGVHMMSGLVVWAAVAALLDGSPLVPRRGAYAALMVGTMALANTHTLGLLWVTLIGVTLLAFVGPRRAWITLGPRTTFERTALLLAVAGLAFALWWNLYAHPNTTGQAEGSFPGNPWGDIAMGVALWLLQAIGAFPLRNEPAPLLLYAVALLALVALTVVTVRALRGQRALSRAVLVLLFFSLVVPVVLTYATYATLGLAWQGRYGMPYSVGLFVLAGVALDRGLRTPPIPVLTIGATTWVFAHVVGQLGVLDKQRADPNFLAATGWWPPPTILVAAVGVLAVMSWISCLRAAEPEPAVERAPLLAPAR